jgi:hypothetical protein
MFLSKLKFYTYMLSENKATFYLFTFIWISYASIGCEQNTNGYHGAAISRSLATWQKWLVSIYSCLQSNKSCDGENILKSYVQKYQF